MSQDDPSRVALVETCPRREGPFIHEGRVTQVRTFRVSNNNRTQVNAMEGTKKKKVGKQGQEVKL